MIARDTFDGLEAGLITEAEALEQSGARDVDGIYERVFGAWTRHDDDRAARRIAR